PVELFHKLLALSYLLLLSLFGSLLRPFDFSLCGLAFAGSLPGCGIRCGTTSFGLSLSGSTFGFGPSAALGFQTLLLFRLRALLFGFCLPFRRGSALRLHPCFVLPLQCD